MWIDGVDVFCGVGGLTHGLLQAGISVTAGIDIDPDSQYAYEKNNGAVYIKKSVVDVDSDVVGNYLKSKYTLLAGCAPCQPFSALNQGKKLQSKDWSLLGEFSKLVREVAPTFVTMENVPQLSKHKIFQDFICMLAEEKYYYSVNIVKCQEYGIPQRRKRLVVLASKIDKIELLRPTHADGQYVTVRDVIGHLQPLKAGSRSLEDPMHWCASVSDLNLKRLQCSKPNGTWKDWPADLIASCHKKLRVQNFTSAYGRMSWDEPAPTITTQCHGISHGRFGHPEQDRPISLREAALLQTFPEKYEFFPPGGTVVRSKLSRMIGNAVPVELGRVIGNSIVRHLEQCVLKQ